MPPKRATAVSVAPTGSRGKPAMIRSTAVVGALIEGMALADEAMSAAGRIQVYAATGARLQIINEAGRLGHRAQAARAELRRLAQGVDR